MPRRISDAVVLVTLVALSGPARAEERTGERGFLPVPDRWRIGFPRGERYPGAEGDVPHREGAWWNPYEQNVLKGDTPIAGDDLFLELTAASDTLAEARRRGPAPEEAFVSETLLASVEVSQGDTAFRPKDWAVRVTPVANASALAPSGAAARFEGHIGLQEAFVEATLVSFGPSFDVVRVAAGIQPFTSDFRGLLFADEDLGVRLSGSFAAARGQWNAAWLRILEKDARTALARLDARDQDVFVANLSWQDFLSEGYTASVSYHFDRDRRGADLDAHYVGWGGDGHIGRLNLMHQAYFALGHAQDDALAGRPQRVQAHMEAVEASIDLGWLRPRASFLHASGDRDPADGVGEGFSAILENPLFAGSTYTAWGRQAIPLAGGQTLKSRLSLFPDLRGSKLDDPARFVNPGLLLAAAGLGARLTPKLAVDATVGWMWFAETASVGGGRRAIGLDAGAGAEWRPLLTENVIVTVGTGALFPGEGLREVAGSGRVMYSGFVGLTLTW